MERVDSFETDLRAAKIVFTFQKPLAMLNTFRIGGPARYFAEPRSTEELSALLMACRRSSLAPYPLGGGSNLLVRDGGVDGVVVSFDRFNRLRDDGAGSVTAGSGLSLSKLVKESIDLGYGGLETLAGIPGCVGGAAAMNAGGKYGEFGSFIERIEAIDGEGKPLTLPREKLLFRYRGSNLQGIFIAEVTLSLKRDASGQAKLLYQKIMEEKKRSQPMGEHNAGCMFKNPPGAAAGKMIDEAGLKGLKIGNVRISEVHANFVINEGGGRAEDVLALIEAAREAVRRKFNVTLETEVVIW